MGLMRDNGKLCLLLYIVGHVENLAKNVLYVFYYLYVCVSLSFIY